jgi:DNA-binding MarR family transcriptional regulator
MTGPKESLFGLHLSMINRAAQAYFTRELKNLPVGPGQQAYLLAIQPGEAIVQEELVRRLRVDPANVTRALAALEMAALVRRRPDPQDRRAAIVELTDDGIQVRRQVERISRNWISLLKGGLDDEQWNQIQDLTARMAASLYPQ